jgi:hypothetical protein
MGKFKYFSIVLAGLVPFTAWKANAQPFAAPIDLLGPMQEKTIQDLQQGNSTRGRNRSPVRYGSIPPGFIPALQQCDNEKIARVIEARRVVEDVLFYPPKLLRRARQCGAISSARLEQLLNYQRRYFQIDQPSTTNLPAPSKSRKDVGDVLSDMMSSGDIVGQYKCHSSYKSSFSGSNAILVCDGKTIEIPNCNSTKVKGGTFTCYHRRD